MSIPSASGDQSNEKLRIVHVFRSPVGGIFRHVRDLVDEQVKAGHEVGIVCDNNTGGEFEESYFRELEPKLHLGLHRIKILRSLGFGDIAAARKIYSILKPVRADILHSHGAKGGAYARLANALLSKTSSGPACLYSPHGGSVHYDAATNKGRVYFSLERLLERWTDRLIFVSKYEQEAYREKVGTPKCPESLVYNGVNDHEFAPVPLMKSPADFLYIGMMRDLKGVDIFLNSISILPHIVKKKISICMVGDGPDLERYKIMAQAADPNVSITFLPPKPAREAFALARCVVVPSRAESMPYLVLEALAAEKPLIATRVGGIPEIFGPISSALVEPGDTEALSTAMAHWINKPSSLPDSVMMAAQIKQRFSTKSMADAIMTAYRSCL